MYIDNFYLNMNRTVKKCSNCNKYHTKRDKNNFKINFLILKYIFPILENKILKNPRFFNKNFFQFHKNNFKINFLFEKIILLNF